jgi:hypothetical protein
MIRRNTVQSKEANTMAAPATMAEISIRDDSITKTDTITPFTASLKKTVVNRDNMTPAEYTRLIHSSNNSRRNSNINSNINSNKIRVDGLVAEKHAMAESGKGMIYLEEVDRSTIKIKCKTECHFHLLLPPLVHMMTPMVHRLPVAGDMTTEMTVNN